MSFTWHYLLGPSLLYAPPGQEEGLKGKENSTLWEDTPILFLLYAFLYLLLAALSLHCCIWAFSTCSKRGYSLVAVHRPLTVVASLFVEHGLPVQVSVVVAHGLRLPCGMWSLPRPRIEPRSSALAGRFLTPGPPGRSWFRFLKENSKR